MSEHPSPNTIEQDLDVADDFDDVYDLIAAAEAAGAYEYNRWVADGMLCRRYISPDGNIDLTVRVP